MSAKFIGIGLSAALLAWMTAMPIQARADDVKFDSPIVGSSPKAQVGGVPSAGAPWVVRSGHARLEGDGSLEVEVTALVLAASVGAPRAGTTAGIPQVAASVVCGDLVQDTTDPVTFPPSGSFEIRAHVTLPEPACQGAAVLIRIVSPANTPPVAFIAATGILD
jgi:hypothetical protein